MHFIDWIAGSIKSEHDCWFCGLSVNCLASTFDVSSSFWSPNKLRLIAVLGKIFLLSCIPRRFLAGEVLDCRKFLTSLKLGISF